LKSKNDAREPACLFLLTDILENNLATKKIPGMIKITLELKEMKIKLSIRNYRNAGFNQTEI